VASTRSSKRSTSSTTISSPTPRRSRTSSISLVPFAICRPMATSFAVRIWPSSVRTRHDDWSGSATTHCRWAHPIPSILTSWCRSHSKRPRSHPPPP